MTSTSNNKFNENTWPLITVIVIALLMGATVPFYVDILDGQISKLLALPALLVFGFIFWYDKKLTLIFIILLRSSGDIFLESTRFSMGGYQVGVGGLINAFVILIGLAMILEKPKVYPKEIATAWLIFLSAIAVGTLLSPVKLDAVKIFLSFASNFFIFIAAFYLITKPDDLERYIKMIIISSLFPVIFSVFDIAQNHSTSAIDGFRLKSTFNHPNIFAFYLTLIISLSFYMAKISELARPKKHMYIYWTYTFVLIALLVLTKTRSAWIGCFLLFFAYAFFFEKKYYIYIVCALLGSLFIPSIQDRFSDLLQGNEVINYSRLNSFAWRTQLWESALTWLKPKNYILGNGIQSFKEYSLIFFPLSGSTKFGAHNVYIQLIFEIGLFGLIAYLWLHFKVALKIWSILEKNRIMIFIFIIIIVNNLVFSLSDNMLAYLSFNWYLWFLIGAGCAYSAAVKFGPASAKRDHNVSFIAT